MRNFKIIYEQKNIREVWVKVSDEEIVEGTGENASNSIVAQKFWRDFKRYDEESDECCGADNGVNIISIDEINEDGDEI